MHALFYNCMNNQLSPLSPPQLGLFDVPTASVDQAFSGLARRWLDDTAWVDYQPGWLSGDGVLFNELCAQADWQAERRQMFDHVITVPRLTATVAEGNPPSSTLMFARRVLQAHYQRTFTSVRLAWYRDGRDSVAMHGDRVGRRRADTVVAILSLGARRRFLLKPASGGASLRFDLGGGDLLVMGGACQRTWRHGVPKIKSADPRVSVQFREEHVAE